MADIDLSPTIGVDVYQSFTPTATVSVIVPGIRKVTVQYGYGGQKAELTSIVDETGREGPDMEKLNEIDSRLRTVEQSITRIDERMNHMPTSFGMWAAIIGVVVPVGAAVVGILWWVIDSSIAPLLAKAAGG